MIRVQKSREAHSLADKIADSIASGTTLTRDATREAVRLEPHQPQHGFAVDHVMRFNRALEAIGVSDYRAGVREGKIAWFSIDDGGLRLTDVTKLMARLAGMGLELKDLDSPTPDLQKKVAAFTVRRSADERRRARLEYLGTIIRRTWLMSRLSAIEKAILTGNVIDGNVETPTLSDGQESSSGSIDDDIRALRDLYEKAARKEITTSDRVILHSVSRDAKERIASVAGINDLTAFVDVVIEGADMTHVVARHSEKGEAKNRRPFTANDVDLLPMIINNPTSVKLADDRFQKQAVQINLERQMSDTLLVVIELNATPRRRKRGEHDRLRIRNVYWLDKKKRS